MGSNKDQRKAGIRARRRGQQMGTAGKPDQNRNEMDKTPALRGRQMRRREPQRVELDREQGEIRGRAHDHLIGDGARAGEGAQELDALPAFEPLAGAGGDDPDGARPGDVRATACG